MLLEEFGLLCIAEGKAVPVPLLGVRAAVEVHDFIAEIKLSQCFHNAEKHPIEALYRFPVDEASSVCGFSATFDDGSVVNAHIREKDEAIREYREATQAGKQAQLLAEERPDIFSMTVGNLPPGGTAKVEITLVTTLKAEGPASRLLLPTSIAPRYTPLGADAVPPVPASATVFYSLEVDVAFHTLSDIAAISSPTHPGLAASHAGTTGQARLRGVAMDRDLVILCAEAEPHAPRACVELAPDGSAAGLVSLCPAVAFRDEPRDFVFVVDRSGSMGSAFAGKTQVEWAGEALELFLRALPEDCRFNVVSFGSRFEALFPAPAPYSDETLAHAARLARGMRADLGGTELLRPLEYVLEAGAGAGASGRRTQVFVLTDGQVSNEGAVLDLVRRHARGAGGARLFAVGVGHAVSHHLVEGIARAVPPPPPFLPSAPPMHHIRFMRITPASCATD
jgi:hypothetical protein